MQSSVSVILFFLRMFSFTIYQEAAQGASIRPAVAFNEGTLMRRHDELEYEIGAELLKDFK